MALKLVRRGAVVKTLTPQRTATGWVNCQDSKGSVYPAENIGTAQTTVTATGCDAVRILDWAVSVTRATVGQSDGLHSATAITTGRFGPVVQVLNPTENTEVIMHVVPIPPPCVIARFWGGGRCGVKEDRQRAAYIWRQVAGRASRWGGHAPCRPASPRREVHTPSGVATSGEKRVRRNSWPGGSGQVATNTERGYGRFGVAHACGAYGVRDRNVHRRVTALAAGGGWRNWLYAKSANRSNACTASTWTKSSPQACGTNQHQAERPQAWGTPLASRGYWKSTAQPGQWSTSGTPCTTPATFTTGGDTTAFGQPGSNWQPPNHPGGGVNGPAETPHSAGQCAHALHRENPVMAQLGHVGTSTTTPRAHHQCQWGDAGNGIGTVEGRDSRGPGTDLPRRREHGQPNPRHLRLRGPATHLQHGCRSAFDADTHTPALTPVGGERCGA